MKKWYELFPKNTGLSLYVWIIFCLLPFYFIFKSSSKIEILIGLLMVILFFTAYRLSFLLSNKYVYIWVIIQMIISGVMTILFGYVYFALFLAFFIGNIVQKPVFITLYIVHSVTTIATILVGFFVQTELFIPQIPYLTITLIGVILLPITIYLRNKREELEQLLDVANQKLASFAIIEERERIARDLHDTLGQKLSLIGLKSDLASKVVATDPEQTKSELEDINRTARTALKEVRELVSHMRTIKLVDELVRIKQMLTAANISVQINGSAVLKETPLLTENVLSMCLKEAITNVVKHSQATQCEIDIDQTDEQLMIRIRDDGVGIYSQNNTLDGHGIRGMKERLEFMNGQLMINEDNGTTLSISIPRVVLNNF
ncbi:MAG TPA: sensor histidine kinase [Bacillota bacterium]|nr:sensor histidine kinase [Bacillota bacterium]